VFFEGLTNSGVTPVLETALSYTEARHKVLAENVANLGTPGYRARQLNTREFQRALGEAWDRRQRDAGRAFAVEGREFVQERSGHLRVSPSLRPTENLLFHDDTNASLEREMSDLAENALAHQMTSNLLQRNFEALRKAIRGRV
jgi:flagellar basal-body rod protein FlgB